MSVYKQQEKYYIIIIYLKAYVCDVEFTTLIALNTKHVLFLNI